MKLLAIAVTLLLSYSGWGNAKTITFVSDQWCPYVCDVKSNKPGILVEAVQHALKDSRYLPKFMLINWARAIRQVRQGEHHGLIATYVSDAPDLLFLQTPIIESQNCFYNEKQDDWRYRSPASLDQRLIAVMNGYSYGAALDSYITSKQQSGRSNVFTISGTDEEDRRLQMLAQGKIDTILEDKNVMPILLDRMEGTLAVKQTGCLKPEGVTIGFSPESELNRKIVQLLNQNLAKLRNTPKMQAILSKYRIPATQEQK